ncbi:UDP-N-acetylmuramate--L-alanine ligase [Limibacter armeniacum]|uniref:UDP-N-acetylmuramate--L-alanine ligase n=1 Tax=Limibacter armeniacum TaxID=466084 RepID=UPI002FE58D89
MISISIEHIRYVYFVGIGGIGMSAIARWFNTNGKTVAGYDRTPTPLTKALEKEGIAIHFEDDVNKIPEAFLQTPQEEVLCVYTPAIPKHHQELNFLQDKGYNLLKRSEVLGIITKAHFCIGVAGTHGKTTTSSLLAHMLTHAGKNCTGFLGGIATNYNSNLVLAPNPEEPQLVVVEADEFDRSFLRLHPNISIVTNAEADHLDIYGNEDAVKDSFNAYIRKLDPEEGQLFFQHKVMLAAIEEIKQAYPYGIDNGAIQAKNIRISDHCFVFNLQLPDRQIKDIPIMVPGFHNVENAVAAASVCWQLGLTDEQIRDGIASYKGVKRRFEYIVQQEGKVYIDDYAHHPTELEAFIQSAKALYPEEKLTVIFQPHLYSRTRDFADGFAKSLSLADKVLLMEIYPARELPIEGVSASMIFEQVSTEKEMVTEDNLLDKVKADASGIIATVGAGNIDRFVPQLKALFEQNA